MNDELRKLHNAKRLLHESPPLVFDVDLAKKLQAQLNSKSATFSETTLLSVGTAFTANCAKNIYKHDGSVTKDIKTVSKKATDDWYLGNKVYDYKTGDMAAFDAKSRKLYENFTRMMWKSSTKVAFGMVNPPGSDTVWVVGYYCYDQPVVSGVLRSIDTVRKNVGRYCFTNGYNDCYNQRALARHNERREAHAGYIPLALDTDIAKAIQTLLTSTGFTGTISSQDRGKYSNCGENIFVLTDQTKLSQVSLTNLASDFWYGGMKYWDIAAGVAKAGNK